MILCRSRTGAVGSAGGVAPVELSLPVGTNTPHFEPLVGRAGGSLPPVAITERSLPVAAQLLSCRSVTSAKATVSPTSVISMVTRSPLSVSGTMTTKPRSIWGFRRPDHRWFRSRRYGCRLLRQAVLAARECLVQALASVWLSLSHSLLAMDG